MEAKPTLLINRSFINLLEIEEEAQKVLPRMIFDYYSSGSESRSTLVANLKAFAQFKLTPRVLRNVSNINMATEILGISSSFPVMVAPMAMQRMAHPDGEVASAQACKRAGIPFILSTMSNSSIEEVASSGHPSLLFQLYVIRNREVVAGWVKRAQTLGFRALVITVDAPYLGRREADERNRFCMPSHLRLKILESLYVVTQNAAVLEQNKKSLDNSKGSGLSALFRSELDSTLDWDIIPWLRTVTSLPIILKGVMSPLDAQRAMSCGVNAIVVSNHGGRQLDHAPTSLDVLPAVLEAVQGRIPVIVDGGIRRGTDVLKALALGASAVLLGRPVLYGLALDGEHGVARVLNILKQEFKLAMALTGCSKLSDISPDLIFNPKLTSHL
ncbi:hypothetical protein CEUSTIGMA_g233.t1 [Chlamydomonas eustigma]|uniref:FMN hydroxy acid dehydrogenase domain-containing protein n=1 Tax=Chlamydomonas eustigma TaxID=1157962 RepID=A0A250WPK8_9CHLO|nr:hypothetical protein CEUSTIGMA_g233.t1 [Chlamydomonas eustigma]|eukprot:GAX72777.1 hypothetical protein CEUSTIGMA_g233.t1 [Chlamydomonas eustigma]